MNVINLRLIEYGVAFSLLFVYSLGSYRTFYSLGLYRTFYPLGLRRTFCSLGLFRTFYSLGLCRTFYSLGLCLLRQTGAEDLSRLPDEVHYVRVPNTSWDISLWRYLPYSESGAQVDEQAESRAGSGTASATSQPRKKVRTHFSQGSVRHTWSNDGARF